MRRAAAALLGGALAAALGLGASCERRPQAPAHPNVVLIVIDTLRPDRLPFYGHTKPTAPFLAKLAERSLVFTRANSTSSWTAPAMASLFTSLHPFQHGMHTASLGADRRTFEVKVLPEAVPTLPESLRSIGYKTFGVTDNQNVSEKPGFGRGFDRFSSTNDESAEAVNRTVLAWRDEIRASEPYFLYVHYMDPHIPYRGREPLYREGSGASEEREDALERYDSEIRWVDRHIEELFSSFEWGDDTVVLVTSDHGEEFGEHGGEQHGRTLHAEVVNVPLVLSFPARFPEGRRIDSRVSLVDVAPTILSLTGHPGEPTHVGRSLVDAGASEGDERSIYTELVVGAEATGKGKGSEVRGITRGSFKLLEHDGAADELFDLQSDAGETRNVLEEHREVAAELSSDLDGAVAGSPRFEPGVARIPLDPKTIEKLEALGYAK